MDKNLSVILVGIKHCGKSALGKIISEKLSIPFYDTDAVLSELTGKTPREIFSLEGEEAFKSAEKDACKFIVNKILTEESRAVIATGGGICNNSEALEELRKIGKFIFLCANEEVAFSRIEKEISVDSNGKLQNLPAFIAKKNPADLEQVRSIFHRFYEERVNRYKLISDILVAVDNSSKQQNADRVLSLIKDA